jgi:hypothetical protein
LRTTTAASRSSVGRLSRRFRRSPRAVCCFMPTIGTRRGRQST